MSPSDASSSSTPSSGRETSSATIVAEGIRHTYPGASSPALDGVNLAIGVGLYGLLGPNGAGKSTLMRILCTLLEPSGGRASVAGFDVVSQPRRVRERLGYLPQEFGGWRLQRVEEVLDTLALLSGLRSRKRRKQRIAEVLDSVGLGEVAERKVKKLSGGMVRRLGVAQALIHEPEVLIVDEPTVGLDPEERIRFRKLMTELARERTILLSTHIVSDLGSGCRRIGLLDGGRMIFQGSPEELLSAASRRVFQLTVAEGGEEDLGPDVEIVSRTVEGLATRLRGVTLSGTLPPGGSVVETPTLEEAYLAFMAERGRVEAIRSDEGSAETADREEGA